MKSIKETDKEQEMIKEKNQDFNIIGAKFLKIHEEKRSNKPYQMLLTGRKNEI